MYEMDDLLQHRIEQLEAGEPLAACLAGLPPEEAEVLRLIAQIQQQEEEDLEQYRPIMEAQRVDVLQAAARHLTAPPRSSSAAPPARPSPASAWQQLWAGLMSRQQLSTGLAFLLIVGVLIVAWAGTSWLLSGNKDKPTATDDSPASLAVQPPQSTESTSMPPTTAAGSDPSSAPDPSAASVAPPPQYTAHLPVLNVPPLQLNAQTAALEPGQGLVEVQGGDGSWTAVSRPTPLTAGQRVRTGALSSATLTFFDGSSVRLGPDSELSIDNLNAPAPADGLRTVALTQWRGESHHDVVTREDDSTYTVASPAGTGTARGTQFQVIVQNSSLVQFIVTEGQVDVTNPSGSITIISGQASTVIAGQPPTEPYFFVSGEGEVAQTGPTWIIAGQAFQTNEHTRIVGNPQVGDLVRVEGYLRPDGTRLAIRILLLHRAPVNRFSFTGEVESMGDPVWVIAGQNIIVNAQTQIEGDPTPGDTVRVDGIIVQGGTLLAENIQLLEDAPGLPFEFAGIVQTINAEAWTISGKTITLNDDTVVEAGIVVGDQVRVQGWILADDTWLAGSIERMPAETPTFDFTGIVQTIDPWQVSYIPFETREWTSIDEGIIVGSRVRVSGSILPDGTWVAAEILLLDNFPQQQVVFVGRVNSINPWVVGQMSLTVNGATQIIGDVQVGDLVQVRATVQAGGEWLALTIRKLTPPNPNMIIIIEGPIASINGNLLVIGNFTVQVSPDHPILGLLEEGDVVRVIGRLQNDGLVIALVIYNVIGSPSGEITVRVEGTIEAIEGNLILVNGIWLWLDPAHSILALLQVGDFVSVEGYFGNHGGSVVLIVVNILIIDITTIPQDCYWHEGMGMGHWHCGMGMGMGMGMGEADCHWHEAMGMSAGHWHCGMGMGMGNP